MASSTLLRRSSRRGVLVLVLVLGCLEAVVFGQEKARWQIGINAVAGIPKGEFRDSIDDTRWGGAGYFTRRFRDTPIRFGLELGLLGNGSTDIFLRGVGIFGEEARLTNGIYFGRFLTRVQPVFGRLAPYVEGAVGLQGFETNIVLKDCVGRCTIATPSSNLTYSLGGGGGLSFRLTHDAETESGFSLDVGVRYLFGGETEFFLPSDLPELAEDFSAVPQRSRTDWLAISFGIVFDF